MCSLSVRLLIRDRKPRLRACAKLSSAHSAALLWLLNINVDTAGQTRNITAQKRRIVLSNHLSYLDIFILSSLIPSVFIASVDEVKDDILLGTVAGLAGTQFIERRKKANIRKEIESVSSVLDTGQSVALFPEGTTSDGRGVLPFKTPFLAMAERPGIEIQPVCIKYTAINNKPVDKDNGDFIYYYGDMRFLPHFRRLLSLESVNVSVTFLSAINTDGNKSRKEIAGLAYRSISSEFMI